MVYGFGECELDEELYTRIVPAATGLPFASRDRAAVGVAGPMIVALVGIKIVVLTP